MAKAQTKVKRRRRDKDGTQKRLMEAAVEVFAAKGYDAATTKLIAKNAGVAEALIQRYFKGKQGLLMALMKHHAQDEKNECSNLPPKQNNLFLEFENLLNHALVHCAEKKEYLSVAFPRAVVDRSAAKEMAKFLETSRVPAFMERLKPYLADGSISGDTDLEASAYALALAMLSVGFVGQIVMKLDPKVLNRIVKALSKAFSTGLEKRK